MAPLLFTNVEYILLRLVRRFLLPKDLRYLGRYFPYYRPNRSETTPEDTSQLYIRWLSQRGRSVAGRTIVEVGSGATNGAAYALVCAGVARVWCVEPYVRFDSRQDSVLLQRLSHVHHRDPAQVASAVTRCDSIHALAPGADIIVSHSVLEHVRDPTRLFAQMRAVLSSEGCMLHIVDYRDHFFKYPLHFLQFSNRSWQRLFDPGDLPRCRLSEHHLALERAGFDVEILHREEDKAEFERIRPHISADFDLGDPTLGVLGAVVYCEHGKSLTPDQSTGAERAYVDNA